MDDVCLIVMCLFDRLFVFTAFLLCISILILPGKIPSDRFKELFVERFEILFQSHSGFARHFLVLSSFFREHTSFIIFQFNAINPSLFIEDKLVLCNVWFETQEFLNLL